MTYAVACRSEMHCPFRNMFCDHAQTARSVSSSTALAGLPPLLNPDRAGPQLDWGWAGRFPLLTRAGCPRPPSKLRAARTFLVCGGFGRVFETRANRHMGPNGSSVERLCWAVSFWVLFGVSFSGPKVSPHSVATPSGSHFEARIWASEWGRTQVLPTSSKYLVPGVAEKSLVGDRCTVLRTV